jgi:type I site-specific restriction endonuclease
MTACFCGVDVTGVTVRGCLTDVGPTDSVLFMERKPVGVVKAKRAAHVEHGRSRKEITGCLGLHNSIQKYKT